MNCFKDISGVTLRRLIAFWFLVVYLLLGVPIWYKITTIYRAPLPLKYIESIKKDINGGIDMVIPVYLRCDSHQFPDLHKEVQAEVNDILKLQESWPKWGLKFFQYDEKLIELQQNYIVSLQSHENIGYKLPYAGREAIVYYNEEAVASKKLPYYIAQVLINEIFRLEHKRLSKDYLKSLEAEGQKSMAINYSPDVHLSISLLSGDGKPVSWDIERVAVKYLTPLRRLLSPICNFTVDTDIVYFNDLNLHQLKDMDSISSQDLAHAIDLSELSSANYYTEHNSLHLAIIFPSNSTGTLSFINSTRHWQPYMVPQWGTIIINDKPLPNNPHISEDYLVPIMYMFSKEIFQFLGIVEELESLKIPVITIDSFKRVTILKNLEQSVNTLWSLVKMTADLPQMAIPHEVSKNVHEALKLRQDIIEMLNDPIKQNHEQIWDSALTKSNKLLYLCEQAFFHKKMVQQNFLPHEHKIAVYLPLLGPISIVTIAGVFKALRYKDMESETQLRTEDSKEESSRELDVQH